MEALGALIPGSASAPLPIWWLSPQVYYPMGLVSLPRLEYSSLAPRTKQERGVVPRRTIGRRTKRELGQHSKGLFNIIRGR